MKPFTIQSVFCAACVAIFSSVSLAKAALTDAQAEREFEFSGHLSDLGLPDYAQKVIDAVLKERPDLKSRSTVAQANLLIRRGRIDEAAALAATLPVSSPSAQAITLKLGSVYYSQGKVEKAKEIFDAFFKSFGGVPQNAALKKSYVEAAYTQGRMLDKAGDAAGALVAYERILKAKPPEEIVRKIQVEVANQSVALARKTKSVKKKNELLRRANTLAEEVTFNGFDLMFGQAISVIANVRFLSGDKEGAKDVVKTYYADLKRIDASLLEAGNGLSESPLASLRFFRGEMNFAEARDTFGVGDVEASLTAAKKAAGEFYNVFLKYDESIWGGKAGIAFAEVKAFLSEKHDKEIKITIPKERMVQAAKGQLRFADEMFRAGKFEEARARYLEVVNDFPDVRAVPDALHNVIRIYAERGDEVYPRMLAMYLAERFRAYPEEAGNQLLKLGKFYNDADNKAMATFMFEQFVVNFPTHLQASKVVLILADRAQREGDKEKEEEYLTIIKTTYKNDKAYFTALAKTAKGHYDGEKFDEAAKAYATLASAYTPGFEKAQARFFNAFALGKDGDLVAALKAFKALKKDLGSTESNPYRAGDPEAFNELHEQVLFQFAQMLSTVSKDHKNATKLYTLATKNFDDYLGLFPKGAYASEAVYGRGRLELQLGAFDKATATFEELARDYPDSAIGKSALFALVKAAIDSDQVEVAKKSVDKMLADKNAYGASEFIQIGQLMIEQKQFDLARKSMEIVKTHKDAQNNDAILQRALFGLGLSYFKEGNCAEAIKNLVEMREKYPLSALLYDILILLGESYVCEKDYLNAQKTLEQIYLTGEPDYRVKSDFILARIHLEKGDKKKAMGSFVKIILLGDTASDVQTSVYKEAVEMALPLGQELESWKVLKQIGESYIRNFPNDKKVPELRKMVNKMKLKLVE